ncbi:MAG: LLM class flavin-dependent oxidoreductase, partial [Actinomycetota bacterium]|nr:LLM class flavin-dependent oxidoreductase [Actinomycetota bacterium]
MSALGRRMRLGVHLGHWEREPHDVVGLAREAEAAGFDSVWISETWGSDGVALATAIATGTARIGIGTGILQMPGRTPAMAAMSALTIDHLSGGRFVLGVGVSGPQVAEGWHGQIFDDPLGRTREYVEIVRDVLRRKEPVTASGPHYPLPVGKGRALSTNVRPLRTDL